MEQQLQQVRTAASTRAIAKSLRPHQWVKNVLVFGGLLFSRSMLDPHLVVLSLQAFFSFCMAASSVYLLNDLNDYEADRLHPIKRKRPLAAGLISPVFVFRVMCGLAVLSLVSAFATNVAFGSAITIYLVMNVAYSLRLKQVEILDVMIIAMGFVLRAVGGCVAISVMPSPWLILCTMTLALLVGFGKRRNELLVLQDDAENHRTCLRGYSVGFIDHLMTISAAAAVVSYALYTMADGTIHSPALIVTIPFVLYGIFRFLFLVHQKQDGGDPTRLFVSDRPMLVNAACWAIAALAVVYLYQP